MVHHSRTRASELLGIDNPALAFEVDAFIADHWQKQQNKQHFERFKLLIESIGILFTPKT